MSIYKTEKKYFGINYFKGKVQDDELHHNSKLDNRRLENAIIAIS